LQKFTCNTHATRRRRFVLFVFADKEAWKMALPTV
jgi:hypothetical protein